MGKKIVAEVAMGLLGRIFGHGGHDAHKASQMAADGGAEGTPSQPIDEPPVPEPIEEPGELVEISLSEGHVLEARLFEPDGVHGALPGVLWLHGDDPAKGPSSRAAMAQLFTEHRPCVVLVVDHPADRVECHEALAWLRDRAGRYGIASDQLFIGGTGPAADLAIETALYERDEGGVAVAYLMALYPSLGSGWDAGLSGVTRDKGLRGLPACTLIVGMGDPSCEDVTKMVERLRDDDVEVDFHMYRSKLRGTGMASSSPDVAQARSYVLRQFDEAVENRRASQQRVRNIQLPTVD